MNKEEKIRETLESGVEPISVFCSTVYSCSMHDRIAFRTKLVLNSITLGELGPESYRITAEQSERAEQLAMLNIKLILRKIEEFLANGTKFEWISFSCPLTLLLNGTLPDTVTELFGGDKKKISKLCIEFPSSILYGDPADYKEKLLDLEAAGINTLITGFGSEFCPVLRLGMFPFKFVSLDPVQSAYMQDKERAKSVEAIVDYINGLHANVIAEGLKEESEAAPWYKCDSFGYTRADQAEKMTFDEDGEPT